MSIAAGSKIFAADVGEAVDGWITYSPVMYTAMNATRATIARTVNSAKYVERAGLVWVQLDITANASSSGGMAVALPLNAAARTLACGSGGVFGTSPPSQTGTVSLGPGTPTDTIMSTTFTNTFVDIVSGQSFRCSFFYQSA